MSILRCSSRSVFNNAGVALCFLFTLGQSSVSLVAQEAAPPAAAAAEVEKPAFDPKSAVDPGIGMPSPYDKFLALDEVIGGGEVPWAKYLTELGKDVDPDSYTDANIQIPMVLGVRIADGAMAVKARDAEKLNACATDIEALALKLGVKDEELGRARQARTLANNNEWLKVFMELGFLQQEIMQKIDKEESSTRGDLLVIAGWMQGLRYSAKVVGDNYTPETSNYLREPMLVKALIDRAAGLPADARAHALVKKAEETLPKIHGAVDIAVDGSISKESVAKLLSDSEALVSQICAAP